MSNIPQNPNGAATSANSSPVVIASDQSVVPVSATSLPLPTGAALDATLTGGSQQTKITNGTSVMDVVAGDTGNNSAVVTGSRKEVIYSTTTAQAVASTDVSNYKWVSVHNINNGTTSTITFQGSNDNTNWVAVTLSNTAAVGTTIPAISIAVAGVIFAGPLNFRYFRLNVTGITALTTSGVVEFFSLPNAVIGQNMANLTGVVDNIDAVALATTAVRLSTASRTYLFNGATFDRQQSVAPTTNSVGTGIPSAGLVGQFDDVSPTAITENNFGNVRMSGNRNLYGTIRDAAGNERGVNVTAANALTVDASGTTQPVSIATAPVLVAGSAVIGKVGIDQTTPGTSNGVTPVPAATGGPTLARIKAAASTNATNLKASAGQIYGYAFVNNTASAKFVKIYNKASSPTVGTDTPAFTLIVPASGGLNQEFSMGIPLGTGVSYAITGAVADSDTTSTAADDVHGFLLYK